MKLLSITFVALITMFSSSLLSAHELGSNKNPITFGNDQTIIDLTKLEWAPLEVEGLAPGAEIAVLRGDLATGASELVLRFPPGYVAASHSHTSDEVYVWIKGAFTLVAYDGTETKFDGPAYISFPGNAPPHALKCGSEESCVLYLRYSRPFDMQYPTQSDHAVDKPSK